MASTNPNADRVKAYPQSTDAISVNRMTLVVANTPYQGPDMEVEDGFALVVKSDPTNAAAGLLFVGPNASASISANLSWPLVLNESIAYYITNANQLWVSGNTAGDNVVFTVEKRRGK